MANVESLFRDAMQLPDEERATLVDRLYETLGEPGEAYDAAWRAELDRRMAEHDRGTSPPLPWDVAMGRIFAPLPRE